jgi:hypothetical protein
MFNLLPELEKRFVRSEYSRRRGIIAFSFSLAAIIIAALFLVPSHIVSYYRQKNLQQSVSVLKESIATKNQQNLNSTISTTNKKIETVMNEQGPKVTDILVGISHKKSSNIKIKSFQLSRNSSGKRIISLRGISQDRESLFAFANRFKDDSAYGKVDLPISNFAKDQNIDFSMTLTTK